MDAKSKPRRYLDLRTRKEEADSESYLEDSR